MNKTSRFLIILLTLVFTQNVWASDIRKCRDNTTAVEKAENEALKYIAKTYAAVHTNIEEVQFNPIVREAFLKYFKINVFDPSQATYINKVVSNLGMLAKNAERTIYRCNIKNSIYCYFGSILAMVPPPKVRVHLCPSYFDRPFDKQVGTLIHEWGHRWGKGNFDYLNETYCYDSADLPTKKLIRQPDNYMLFVIEIARDGRGIGCFKITER